MKSLILSLLAILFLNCTKNNETEYSIAVKQNNEFLTSEIETFKFRLFQRSQEQPNRFDTIFLNNINRIVKNTHAIKSNSDYKKVTKLLQQVATDKKLKIHLDSTDSENIELLKNNLFITTLKLFKEYEFNAGIWMIGSGCRLGDRFRIWNSIKNDSVFLEVKTWNQYIVQTDSVVDMNNKRIDFIDNENNTLSNIKYSSPTKNSIYYGKVFYMNDESKLMLLQNLHDTIRK